MAIGKPETALVGVSGYGKVHYQYLKALAEAGRINFAAAVIRPASMAENAAVAEELRRAGAEIYPSDDALLAARRNTLDLVCLPVGIEAHRPMACKFLASGINVLLEKPAAGCVRDVRAIIEAEKRSGKFVAVGFHNMYGRDIHAIKREILSGNYGRLRNITFEGAWARPDSYYRRNSWAGKCRAADGSAIFDSPVNNAFAHYLNIPLFCAGPDFKTTAHAVAMQAELVSARDNIETFDTCGVRVVTSQGVTIQVLMTHACAEDREPHIRFDLEYGHIHWDTGSGFWEIRDFRGEKVWEEKLPDWRKLMFDDVVARLADPARFVYTPENALEHTFCIESLHDFFPVRRLAPGEYRVLAERDNQREIPGILRVFGRGFEQNLLPSEAGAPWSREAETVGLEYDMLRAANQ
ncbi:MAG: Gfo/Idh/MocA family oxidoreductase [Lentisphaeria bacterium]|nr:Gfo/Idh/MocA family oxidoreductase [Lentisphaeria bacterium]